MANESPSRRQWIADRLTRALTDIPSLHILNLHSEPVIDGRRFNASVDATIGDHTVHFVVESKTTAYPRDIRLAIEQLRPVASVSNVIPLFAAPRIGITARRMLKEAGVGYFDEGGTLYIDAIARSALALHIDRDREPRPQPRRARELFRGQGAQVIHVLLGRYANRREWNIKDMARESGVTDSTVHKIFSRLEADGTVEKFGSGPQTVRHVTNPNLILDEWSEHHSLAVYRPRRYTGWAQEGSGLLRDICNALEGHGIDYALTLGSGAQLVAPFATTASQVDILVPIVADIAFLTDSSVGLVDVGSDGGENVVLRMTDERWPLMRRQQINGVEVASDIQLYLDLMASPRRGRELAQRIREQRLDWS